MVNSLINRLILVILLLCSHTFIYAQSQPQITDDTLEEIVVTAQKRTSLLQDEAIAITAITADTINRAGGVDPEVLGVLVPNLHVGKETNRDGLQITIRGVSGTDVRNGADPTTAFHVDGSYVARLSGANAYFYDLERIEVLRGPQGTLYGRNSTAGVVNVITKKPEFDDVGGSIEFTGGAYNLFQAKGALNIPITADSLAARIAFITNDRDGYRENAPSEDGDDADEFSIRSHLLFEPFRNTSLLFTGEYYKRGGVGGVASFHAPPGDTSGLQTEDPAGVNPIDTQGFRDNSDSNFRLELNHSFSAVDVTYLGAFRNHERDFLSDADFTALASINSFVRETAKSDTWTHEVRLTSTHDGPFQYIIGGYYLDEEINGDFQVGLTTGAGFAGGAFPDSRFIVRFVDRDLTNESLAAFLHTSYDITNQFQAVAGARYTADKKDKGGDPSDVGATADTAVGSFQTVGIVDGPTFFLAPQIADPSFNETTWKLGVNYTPNDDHLFYLSASTGFKAGGYNRGSQADNVGAPLAIFEPETVTAYEIGWKAALFNNRSRLNLAAFYYDYEDLQQGQTFTNSAGTITNQTINATSADVFGIEFEGETLIGKTGQLSVSLGYLSAEFGTFTGVDNNLMVGSQSLDASGNRLTRAPEFTATAIYTPVIWQMPFGGSLEPRIQFHYESEVSLGVLDRSFERQDGYTKTDLSLLYTYENGARGWGDSLYAEIFIQNLEDEDVATYQECFDFNQVGVDVQQCERVYAPPRTWGLRAGLRF